MAQLKTAAMKCGGSWQEKMQRRYLSNPVFFRMTDVIVVIEIIGYVQRITSKTSITLFNKVLHQKVFIMSCKTQKVSRE